jgi:hypothetical protein
MVTEQSTQYTRADVLVHSRTAPGWHGEAWHVEIGGLHYAVSAVDLPPVIAGYKSCETAVFPARTDGTVEDYGDLVMLDDVKDHEVAIAHLIDQLNSTSAVESGDGERVVAALALLDEFDAPHDTGLVQALIDDLRNILGGA